MILRFQISRVRAFVSCELQSRWKIIWLMEEYVNPLIIDLIIFIKILNYQIMFQQVNNLNMKQMLKIVN